VFVGEVQHPRNRLTRGDSRKRPRAIVSRSNLGEDNLVVVG
jgi:hypothetical protein